MVQYLLRYEYYEPKKAVHTHTHNTGTAMGGGAARAPWAIAAAAGMGGEAIRRYLEHRQAEKESSTFFWLSRGSI